MPSCPHVSAATFSAAAVSALTEKSDLRCAVCGPSGPSNHLWLCLHQNCGLLGCSEAPHDHSTAHVTDLYSNHVLQMNVETRRVWCYSCNKEIGVPEVTGLKFGSALRPPEDGLYEVQSPRVNPNASQRGLVGLSNLGNTCYMNSALQCLLNTPALAEFFTTCPALVEKGSAKSGHGGAKAFLKLVDETWGSKAKKTYSYVAPTGVLHAIKTAYPMFRGFHQHDSQEFLRCFMDQLHEELSEALADGDDDLDDDNPNLESLSGEASAAESECDTVEEEYETADSGVSEQSSNSAASERTKRRRLSGEDKPLLPEVEESRKGNERDELSSLSSDELDYTDAHSGGSASPLSSSLRAAAMSPRSPNRTTPVPPTIRKRKPRTYRSVISDIFDGKLVSTVQCLTCNRVSLTSEAFQDLSLPIPTYESLGSLRNQPVDDGWLSWAWTWVSGFFYGPNISLHDCLSYFFSADELKGENMYSCERCKKLRNGIKFSRVTDLPDTLCIHLKRFRHDFAFSSKISTKVTFPLVDLDMSEWLHKDSNSKVSMYDLTGIICHHGHSGGGHYTSYGLNHLDEEWYEFDDSSVSKVDASTVINSEAYVLFYRKHSTLNEGLKERMGQILADNEEKPSLMTFFISKQWLNKLQNFAEPGPIDNSDFICCHGGVLPQKAEHVYDLVVALPQPAWNLLHSSFGGGPATNRLYECTHCRKELDMLIKQKEFELQEFKTLHKEFQESNHQPALIFCLSSSWFKIWESFVCGRSRDPPGPIDNRSIITTRNGSATLRTTSDYVQISHDIWRLFHSIYSGGPDVAMKPNGQVYVGLSGLKPSVPGLNTRLRARSVSESLASKQINGMATRSRVKSEHLIKSNSDLEKES